jgi:hypothetical protein
MIAVITLFSFLFFSFNVDAITNTFTNVADSHVVENTPNQNFGTTQNLVAGLDTLNNETAILIQWDVSSIPATAKITGARLTVEIGNGSSGNFKVLEQINTWTENGINWNNFGSNTSALEIGDLVQPSEGKYAVSLNPNGLHLVQRWVSNPVNNHGISIRTTGTNDNIEISSAESAGIHPTLQVSYIDGPPTLAELQLQINAQQTQINQLRKLLAGVVRIDNDINFTGVNVVIKNSLGATNGKPIENPNDSREFSVNGLGNLIIGYDEETTIHQPNKSGSHNIVAGRGHNYSSFGGLVIGLENRISAPYASVSGGRRNEANGDESSVKGGFEIIAEGEAEAK